jgi:DNA-binding NarL/FixJ family response regulator
LLCKGSPQKEIARSLNVSEGIISRDVRALQDKIREVDFGDEGIVYEIYTKAISAVIRQHSVAIRQ